METKQQAPAMQGTQGASDKLSELTHKDKANLLSPHQKRVYNTLLEGGDWSTLDLMQTLRIADPRRAIAYIRKAGISNLRCMVYG